jgi:hypothetical protein
VGSLSVQMYCNIVIRKICGFVVGFVNGGKRKKNMAREEVMRRMGGRMSQVVVRGMEGRLNEG